MRRLLVGVNCSYNERVISQERVSILFYSGLVVSNSFSRHFRTVGSIKLPAEATMTKYGSKGWRSKCKLIKETKTRAEWSVLWEEIEDGKFA